MKRFVEKVIIPYVDNVNYEYDLPLVQTALCIFDVYQTHRGEELLQLLGKNNIRVVYVPASCTDQLQPLLPNNVFKTLLKSEFQDFYASEIQRQLEAGTDVRDVKVDLKLSVIKPLHAKWLQVKQREGLDKKIFNSGWNSINFELRSLTLISTSNEVNILFLSPIIRLTD